MSPPPMGPLLLLVSLIGSISSCLPVAIAISTVFGSYKLLTYLRLVVKTVSKTICIVKLIVGLG